MIGERTVMQEALFYSFRIEDHVAADHLLRSLDRFIADTERKELEVFLEFREQRR